MIFHKEHIKMTQTCNQFIEYLQNPNNWIPLRNEIHEAIIKEQMNASINLSSQLGDKKPTIHLFRGTYAGGKSTLIRSFPDFQDILDEQNQLNGVINLDVQARALQRLTAPKEEGMTYVTHEQCYAEAMMLTSKLKQRLFTQPNLSLVVEQKLNKRPQITDLINIAKATNKTINIHDIDCDVDLSIKRALNRSRFKNLPTPERIERGLIGNQNERGFLISKVASENVIQNYTLYNFDEDGFKVSHIKVDGEVIKPEGIYNNDEFHSINSTKHQTRLAKAKTAKSNTKVKDLFNFHSLYGEHYVIAGQTSLINLEDIDQKTKEDFEIDYYIEPIFQECFNMESYGAFRWHAEGSEF